MGIGRQPGFKHTDEARAKMSEAAKNRAASASASRRDLALGEIVKIATAEASREITAAEAVARVGIAAPVLQLCLREDERPVFDLWFKAIQLKALEEAAQARAEGVV
ncbi:MAG: NUMOD3 domain-containing DNA-binding protein [Amaricoccus sp.]